jgi:hypothetical protein
VFPLPGLGQRGLGPASATPSAPRTTAHLGAEQILHAACPGQALAGKLATAHRLLRRTGGREEQREAVPPSTDHGSRERPMGSAHVTDGPQGVRWDF